MLQYHIITNPCLPTSDDESNRSFPRASVLSNGSARSEPAGACNDSGGDDSSSSSSSRPRDGRGQGDIEGGSSDSVSESSGSIVSNSTTTTNKRSSTTTGAEGASSAGKKSRVHSAKCEGDARQRKRMLELNIVSGNYRVKESRISETGGDFISKVGLDSVHGGRGAEGSGTPSEP